MQRKWKEKDMMLRPFRQGWWISRYRVYLNVWPNAYFRYACPAKLDLWFGCFECLFRLWPGSYLFPWLGFSQGHRIIWQKKRQFQKEWHRKVSDDDWTELSESETADPTRAFLDSAFAGSCEASNSLASLFLLVLYAFYSFARHAFVIKERIIAT